MERAPVYVIAPLSNNFRTYLLQDDRHVLLFTQRPWGEPVTEDWITPQLEAFEESTKPDPDFATLYLPSLLVTKQPAAKAIEFPQLELVAVLVGKETRYLLNPRITLRRYRTENADVVQVPSGAILLMRAADFYAEDIPEDPCCFWFHDGNFPRFLLCNQGFRMRIEGASLTGLSFKLLGYAF
jgi:hypothetical protein